ncbi:MAG TPA: AMP-binding protein [Candidatus Acidoferrales bacterium]|nr:AMP-binding protein [Candidatus Acidoferrales bacterium]
MRSPRSAAPEPVVRLIPELVEFAARQYGDRPFLLRRSGEGWAGFTFLEAARAVHAFAALLAREGVRAGDRVGLQSENRPEWGLAYLAILEAGAVVVPLDAQLKPQEVGEILATAGASHVVTSGRHHAVAEAVRIARLPALRMLALDPVAGVPTWGEAIVAFPHAPARAPEAEPGDLAVLVFTSGTTGQAKGVMLSHRNLLSNAEGVARSIEVGPGDRMLSILPLHHTFESTIGLLCPLRCGASVAYARGLDSKQLREDMRLSGATIFVAVPLLYEKLLTAIHRGIEDQPAPRRLLVKTLVGVTRLARWLTGRRIGRTLLRPVRARAGLERIRIFASGAAPLAEEVFWGFTDFGWTMVEGYGLTETSPVVCFNPPARSSPGAVGWPLVGVEVRIDTPDADGNGEVAVRGPNVMLGYYGNPAATAEVMRDGWFMTGDLGRFLPDGRVRITGRLKNMIATAAGKKIYPEEVEAQLANSPYVLEVVVVGGRDARGDREEVHAHVYPNLPELELLARSQGRACDDAFVEAALRADVEARCEALAPYKRVKRVFVRRREFPKTTTGKIRRQDLGAAATPARAAGVA